MGVTRRIASSTSSYVVLSVLAGYIGVPSTSAQTPPNTVELQPAPDIAGVIKGGTRPEVVVKGLRAADDPIWLPDIGLVFSATFTGPWG